MNALPVESMRAAVAAIHAGDAALLARLIAAEPRLLHEPFVAWRPDGAADVGPYFRDPKLVWFVANNPRLADPMPPNSAELAAALIAAGAEVDDLTYTLELTMSSRAARESGQQRALMAALLAGGAVVGPTAVAAAGAHRELDALRYLVEIGIPPDAPLAAALGLAADLRERIAGAGADDVALAFALAAINGQREALTLALAAGAEIDAPLAVHAHGTALHQAAINDDVAMVELLLAHGADRERRDTRWHGTPLDWARYGGATATADVLRRAADAT